MKVVFDSNVYVSALAIPGGVAQQALDAAMEGGFQLALSRPILAEVLGVLARKFARDPDEVSRAALFLSSLAELVAPTRRVALRWHGFRSNHRYIVFQVVPRNGVQGRRGESFCHAAELEVTKEEENFTSRGPSRGI